MLRLQTTNVMILLAVASAGCSALIDSSQYVGGGQDAGADGQVPTDGQVPADGQVPTDGQVPADADMPNRPPVLSTLGLSTYMPALGESLRALPGPTSDPDGDDVVVRYQWFRNDTPITGATAPVLATSALAAGDELRVEAWPYDGELEGERVHAGAVTLQADTTRWRPVMPDDFSDFSPLVYDAPNRRYVRIMRELVWEYTVDETGDLRVKPIAMSGIPPDGDGLLLILHDPEGRRAIALTLDTPDVAYVVDLSRRGAEAWSQEPIAGTPPDVRLGAATWYDSARRLLWLYGGFNERVTPPIGDQLWTLDLRPGALRWKQIVLGSTEPPPALFGATMTEDPTEEGTLILAGGGDFSAGGATVSMWRITPIEDSDTATLDLLPTTLPEASFGTASATDYANGRILFAGGGTDIDEGSFGVAIFDPESGSFVRPSAPDISPGVLGLLHADPDDPGRFLLFRGLVNTRDQRSAGFDLRAIDAESGEASLVVHEERPRGLSEGAWSRADSGSTATLIGGRTSGWEPNPIVYRMNMGSFTWSTVTTTGDAVSGESPLPRYGAMSFDSSPWSRLHYFGGYGEDGFMDTEVWELLADQWVHRTLASSAGVPEARQGAAYVAAKGCGADQNIVFGGESDSWTLLADAHTLVCPTGDRLRDCHWEEKASGGDSPPPLAWATLGVDDASSAWLVGGWTGSQSASMTELHTFYACFSPAIWTRVTATGASTPGPRHGHSMLYDGADTGGLSSFIIFGGTGDDSRETTFDDVWRLEIINPTSARWVPIEPSGMRPGPRAFHQAVWDELGSRMIVFGGRDPHSTYSDVWELVIRP